MGSNLSEGRIDRCLFLFVTEEVCCCGKQDNDFGCTVIPFTQCDVPPPLKDSSSLSMLSIASTVGTAGFTLLGSGTLSLSTWATLTLTWP